MAHVPVTAADPAVVGSLALMREITPDSAGDSPQFVVNVSDELADPSPSDTASFRIGQETSGINLIEGGAFRVGRASGNDLALKDADVSRFHAVFYASKSGIVVTDLSSLNGTFVNEKRISAPFDLKSGDIVRIGRTRLVVSLVKQCVDPTLSQDHTQLVGMRAVDITVLVADIRRYTTMSQQLPSDDVVQMLQRWCEMVSMVVRDFGGEVDKYIGDCVMAFWIAPHSKSSEAACQAVRASQTILKNTNALATEWQHETAHPWACRTVLNSGTAMMGVVAGGRGRDLTVLGDCVNVAFRLEHVASSLEQRLVISEATAQLLKQTDICCQEIGATELEGRSGGVRIFSVA